MNEANYSSFADLFREMAAKYEDLPVSSILSAYSRVGTFDSYTPNPFIQNRRVKQLNGIPAPYTKSEIARMLEAPQDSEIPLRQVAKSLEYTAQPFFNLRKTYQDVLTYRYYTYPEYVTAEEAKSPALQREGMLVDKLCNMLRCKEMAHRITGQAIQSGKVFYTNRISVDKSHNKVNYAFAQQLPQDWCKIVGYNNISTYTVAFNMMYFIQPGAAWWQYGDLFEPYISNINAIVKPTEKIVYASESPVRLDLAEAERLRNAGKLNGNPEIYNENGAWFYWVTLPADRVWTFEVDDTNTAVISPLSGLILTMSQIAQYENLQLELYSNPLVAVMTGEIPYSDTKDAGNPNDVYKLSPTGRAYFETLWYQMMSATNTGGIGFFAAPVENLKLQQLAESPSATDISAKGYADAIQKSGIGVIPATAEPRVGMVNISAKLAARYAQTIYSNFERMMDSEISKLGLRWGWRFKMFGDIFSESDELDDMRKSMASGILPDLYRYNALMGRSIYDDLAMSRVADALGILELRRPLDVSHAILPTESKAPTPEGGRPPVESSEVQTEGQEASMDGEGD